MPRVRPRKQKATKTLEDRQAFRDTIRLKFSMELGLTPEEQPSIAAFYEILDDWVRTGLSAAGKVPFPEAPFGGRYINYILPSRKTVQPSVKLSLMQPEVARRGGIKGT